VLPLLVAAGIDAARSEDKRGTVIALRKSPTDDATNATMGENSTGKPNSGGNTAHSNATANATSASNATANATRNPADRAESDISGISGIRFGDFSEEACTPGQAGRIRRLVKEGMSETWARRTVLADGHPLGCGCEVCL